MIERHAATRRVRREAIRVLSDRPLLGQRLLVAASGGIDSTCLAHVLAELAVDGDFEVALGHVHHGLRGRESDDDAAAVSALAQDLGVAYRFQRADPGSVRSGRTSRERPTLQEAARAVRYDALRSMASEWGATRIATAHTADDQTETVLLRMLRGAGPDSLAGIPVRSEEGRLVRPLLGFEREELRVYAAENRLSWREDSSNASSDYARNRLRNQWIPGLAKEFNPRLNQAIRRFAEAAARDRAWLEELVEGEFSRRFHREASGGWMDCEGWAGLPDGLALRLARRTLGDLELGRDVTSAHLERISAFLGAKSAPGELELPGGLRVRRQGTRGCFYRVQGNRSC